MTPMNGAHEPAAPLEKDTPPSDCNDVSPSDSLPNNLVSYWQILGSHQDIASKGHAVLDQPSVDEPAHTAALSGVDLSVAIEADNAFTLRPHIRPTNVSKKRDKRIEKSLRNQLDYERRKGRLSAEKQDGVEGLSE